MKLTSEELAWFSSGFAFGREVTDNDVHSLSMRCAGMVVAIASCANKAQVSEVLKAVSALLLDASTALHREDG
jgi:hypothetical protein